MDNGKVEYRTIAFCTHLTVSRWEPTIPSPAVSTPSNEEENVSTASSTADNGQAHAARLLSLANYIRHILSLTVTVPSAQSNVNVNAKQQHKQDETRGQDCNTNPGFSATSSGPGPIKSESNRRHRFSPAYHHHPSRRNTQQPQYAERDSSAIQHHSQTSLSHSQRLEYPNNHGYREGGRASENRETSQFYTSPNASCTQQPIRNHAPNMHNQPNVDRNPPPLLKIPFPNLTLTLALIYVDRLKAKYPEAKGEPGCSHRLFLVAFIIAAKYRCSVELSPPVPRDPEEQESNDSIYDRDSFDPNQTLETRLNAALIFSNHAWVRLLNLGSFYRQPSSASAVTAGSTTDSQDQTPQGQPATVQSRSGSPAESPSRDTLPSLSSIINPAASSPTTGMMQVEDLDRMETEFLTFLDFDLATLSHDLETCWNLLVGKN
ncbi:hypothetical protein BGX27_000284 [Mortierella sp. AM989]|nr:hypothetical protein BGX27_000284 [Mortierella sp. AM989]